MENLEGFCIRCNVWRIFVPSYVDKKNPDLWITKGKCPVCACPITRFIRDPPFEAAVTNSNGGYSSR